MAMQQMIVKILLDASHAESHTAMIDIPSSLTPTLRTSQEGTFTARDALKTATGDQTVKIIRVALIVDMGLEKLTMTKITLTIFATLFVEVEDVLWLLA